MKKITLSIVIFFIGTLTIQAQLGGLLKKAKDKVIEKKSTENIATQQSSSNDEVAAKVHGSANTYYLYDQQYGYRSGGSNYTLAALKQQDIKFTPYSHVRQSDEKGTFHFAKDYPELANITEPVNNDLTITFSNKTFTGGGEVITNSFTSANGIYAKITATKGTLKDALKLADNDDGIKFQFVLYDDNDETINKFATIEKFQLTDAQAKGKTITFDIIPNLANFSNGKQSDFWVGTFARKHDQYTFKKNGSYKVAVVVSNEMVDDWGKLVYGKDIEYHSFFDYNFSAKDAAAVFDEADKVNDLKNAAKKNAITALPKQWAEKTSALAMGLTQAQLIAMYQNSFSPKLDPHTVVKFHASPSNGGWTTVNNDYGIPIYRYSNQWYTIFVKFNNGKACFFQGFGLRQQYMGGGTYGKAFLDKNDYHMADCETMK
ncbi:MAG: hypothetical protein ABL929_05740 [Ferruginibacter sp.]|nr:hypothetical protein [Ferruginibacter sp.]